MTTDERFPRCGAQWPLNPTYTGLPGVHTCCLLAYHSEAYHLCKCGEMQELPT